MGKQARAGVYGRESKGKAKSVDDQVSLGVKVVHDHGWTLTGTYDDGTSASRFATKPRADWQRLFADIAEGQLDVLVVWEITRGSREPVEGFTWLNLCRDHGVLIYVMSDDELYDPRKTRHYDTLGRALLDGAKEVNQLSDRVLRGTAAAAVSGLPHGPVNYGYERIYNKQTKLLEEQRPHPEHARVVRWIIEQVAKQTPIIEIERQLNALPCPTPSPKGGRWSRKVVRQIATNPAYIGRRVHNGRQYAGVWPPLVDETVWHDAQRVLTEPGRRRAKPGRARWLLTYLGVAYCGEPLHGQPAREGRPARYHCTTDGCVTIGQFEVDEIVTALVVERLSRPDARALFTPDDATTQALRGQVVELTERLDEARRSFLGPKGISAAALAVIEHDLMPQIDDLNRRINTAVTPTVLAGLLPAGEFGAAEVRPRWDALSVAAKRRVLVMLFAEIRVGRIGRRLTRWSSPGERFQVTAERLTVQWRV